MKTRSVREPWWNEEREQHALEITITVGLLVLGYVAYKFLAHIWAMTH